MHLFVFGRVLTLIDRKALYIKRLDCTKKRDM